MRLTRTGWDGVPSGPWYNDRGETEIPSAEPSTTVAEKDPLQPQTCAELLKALAAPERLRIIRFLRDGPRNVTEISKMLGTSLVNVSHHINVLKQAGLVRSEKQGRCVLHSLCPGVLQMDDPEGALDHINLGCCRIELPAPSDDR